MPFVHNQRQSRLAAKRLDPEDSASLGIHHVSLGILEFRRSSAR